jgi:uncharacterized protein
MITPFSFDSAPRVQGFVHRPAVPSGDAFVLTHGAGSNCQAPVLLALAEAFAEAGFVVLRCDLPYRQKRPQGPPYRGDAEQDREGLRNAVQALKELAPENARILLGGHSYGGRQASMLAAETPEIASGLLLMSYPLHPPRQPDSLRTAHFAGLRVPALFVHGARDPFASTEEIETAMKLIPARTSILHFEGAGHDLAAGPKSERGSRVYEIAAKIRDSAITFLLSEITTPSDSPAGPVSGVAQVPS